MNFASLCNRFIASLIDGLIFCIISVLVVFPVWYFFVVTTRGSQDLQTLSVLLRIMLGIINWLYFALSESSPKQATLGKQALGIIVTDIYGKRISFGRATVRYFSKWISGIIIIGYVIAAFTDKRQALHDMIAGTVVFNK
jgi:uncharacterized RDD family membrane protein YckC